MTDYRKIHADTQNVYRRNASGWNSKRNRSLYEKKWLDRFSEHLPEKASVLDAGCGGGEPIAGYLASQGFEVTGIDTSVPLLEIARQQIPTASFIESDMREMKLEKQFDGIIAWDSFFHLDQNEQRQTLGHFFKHLKPQGAILLTVGHISGEVIGHVEGDKVYHSSLDPDEYRNIFHNAGFNDYTFVPEDPDCMSRTVLLARRRQIKLSGITRKEFSNLHEA